MKATQAGIGTAANVPFPLPGRTDDLALWLRTQAMLLRARRFELLDVDNLAQEVERLAKSEHLELGERLRSVCVELLKCKYHPGPPHQAWLDNLDAQRERIAELIAQSPCLANYVSEYVDKSYRSAVPLAAWEARLPFATFPKSNPFSTAELIDPDFVPAQPGSG
ncbi:DUF29 domain-containing protein [Massilia horti]|nr:DUF29 domain-containing protein [Massilia horti]